MKHLFAIHPLPPNAPLFGKADSSPLRHSEFIRTLKARISDIGLDQSGYSGHSFWRGAATAAAIAGYADFEIQLLGRWQSDAYKLYLDVPKNRVLSLSARLHVAAAPAAVLSRWLSAASLWLERGPLRSKRESSGDQSISRLSPNTLSLSPSLPQDEQAIEEVFDAPNTVYAGEMRRRVAFSFPLSVSLSRHIYISAPLHFFLCPHPLHTLT
jgi:hypothetical protein